MNTSSITIREQDFKNIAHDVLSINVNISRWAQYSQVNDRYNELEKQSLNMIACKLLTQQAEHEGMLIDENRFPLIALKRLFDKTVNGDIRGDHLEEILELGEIPKEKIDELIEEKILKKRKKSEKKEEDNELAEALLTVKDDWIESKIYKVATKMATLVEIMEIKEIADTRTTENEIYSYFSKYREELPSLVATALNLNGPEFLLLQEISKLRGAIRWLKQHRAKDCSVLGHSGEVAIFSWMLSLERNPSDVEKATELFWIGLFHDVPERWTGDMASPVKDAVTGLRKATEIFEEKVLEENVYSKLPSYQVQEIMCLMDWADADKALIKGADYASAVMECYRNYLCGSRDRYFFDVVRDYHLMKNSNKKKNLEFSKFFFALAEDVFKKM